MSKMTPKEAVKRPVKFLEEIIDEVKKKDRGYTPTVMSTTVPAWGRGKADYKKCEK